MGSKFDRWTAALSAALVVGALLACKKKEEPPPPVATPTPTPEPPKEEPKKEEPKKKDEVKRYPDKETDESGTVRVLVHNLRVYNEADETTDHVATLNKGTLVNRLARMGNWLLVDYPTGVGELSPGWVKATTNYYKIETKIKPEDVKKQDAGAVIVTQPDAGAKPPDAGTAAKVDAAAPKTDAGIKKLPPLFKLPPKT